MPPLRPPLSASFPLASPQALADIATAVHAPHMLTRGGPYQRALNLVARGADPFDASLTAAAQGKGHVAELAQSTHFTVAAAALGRSVRARPNRIANDPYVDVEVLHRRGARTHGAQLKVGSPSYIRRAVRAGKYEHMIVNAEAMAAVAGEPGITDHLDHRGIAAPQVTAEEAETTAVDVLHRMLLEHESVTQLETIAHAARAGLRDGVVSFALGLVGGISDAVFRGIEIDLRATITSAFAGGARAATRTGLEAWLLLQRFVKEAGGAFSSRLVQRIARSRIATSAIAEVVVETAMDVVDVLRGRLSFEDLLRRFGVHVTTAAGAAVAAAAASAGAGAGFCAIEVNENVSRSAKPKINFLENELWLPTFFIFSYDYLL